MIIDAHIHLWDKQNGIHNGERVYHTKDGRSMFMGEARQMMPPYMTDGSNNVERLIANMNYARVNGAIVTQEVLDGNQNEYLLEAKAKFSDRIKICSLYQEEKPFTIDGFDGIKLCSCKFKELDLLKHIAPFEEANKQGKFVSIDLADGDLQTAQLEEIIQQFPDLRIAIGHFGMVTRENWLEQIKLARYKNVFIESGGITWLFNEEFYPYPSAIKAIKEAADICSYDKLMWGSDYPRTMVEITYKMSYDFITKSKEIAQTDKEKFLFSNAKDFYGFDFSQELPKINHML